LYTNFGLTKIKHIILRKLSKEEEEEDVDVDVDDADNDEGKIVPLACHIGIAGVKLWLHLFLTSALDQPALSFSIPILFKPLINSHQLLMKKRVFRHHDRSRRLRIKVLLVM
jgi:hypothetical protein